MKRGLPAVMLSLFLATSAHAGPREGATATTVESPGLAPVCTISGVVTAKPAPAIQIYCDPPGIWVDIDDKTGAFNCTARRGSIKIHTQKTACVEPTPSDANPIKNCPCGGDTAECNYDNVPASDIIHCPADPTPCTLTGKVTPVPGPTVQMWCSPPGSWFAINDSTGFYSCATSAGPVSIHPDSNSNKNCTCTAPSSPCNYP